MLTGEEKGALLLKSLAPEVVDKILARLSPERSQKVRALMKRFADKAVASEELKEVLQELRLAIAQAQAAQGKPSAKAPTSAAPPPEEEEPPAPPAPPIKDIAPAEALRTLAKLPPERIALVFEGESARTVSIILNFLDDEKAGQVFRFLPTALRNEVSVQFSTQGMPSLDVLRRMALALVVKHQRLPEKSSFPEGAARYRKMADMLRQLEKPQRQQVLDALDKQTPGAANEIKTLMYRFDDVLRLDNRSMQKVLGEIDNQTLAAAIKSAPDEMREKFLANMSKRAQENLREEMSLMRAPPKEEVEQARSSITAVIQRLDLAGELVMTE